MKSIATMSLFMLCFCFTAFQCSFALQLQTASYKHHVYFRNIATFELKLQLSPTSISYAMYRGKDNYFRLPNTPKGATPEEDEDILTQRYLQLALTLSSQEIKDVLQRNGINTVGIFDRSDLNILYARLRKAQTPSPRYIAQQLSEEVRALQEFSREELLQLASEVKVVIPSSIESIDSLSMEELRVLVARKTLEDAIFAQPITPSVKSKTNNDIRGIEEEIEDYDEWSEEDEFGEGLIPPFVGDLLSQATLSAQSSVKKVQSMAERLTETSYERHARSKSRNSSSMNSKRTRQAANVDNHGIDIEDDTHLNALLDEAEKMSSEEEIMDWAADKPRRLILRLLQAHSLRSTGTDFRPPQYITYSAAVSRLAEEILKNKGNWPKDSTAVRTPRDRFQRQAINQQKGNSIDKHQKNKKKSDTMDSFVVEKDVARYLWQEGLPTALVATLNTLTDGCQVFLGILTETLSPATKTIQETMAMQSKAIAAEKASKTGVVGLICRLETYLLWATAVCATITKALAGWAASGRWTTAMTLTLSIAPALLGSSSILTSPYSSPTASSGSWWTRISGRGIKGVLRNLLFIKIITVILNRAKIPLLPANSRLWQWQRLFADKQNQFVSPSKESKTTGSDINYSNTNNDDYTHGTSTIHEDASEKISDNDVDSDESNADIPFPDFK